LLHNQKLPISYKQNLQATCLYITAYIAILRSQGGDGAEYFYDLRRRSGCGAKLFGRGVDAESIK